MSIPTSTTMAHPPPPSPIEPPYLAGPPASNRHPSRPSYTVGYSPPTPLIASASSTWNLGHVGADPRYSVGASSPHSKRSFPSSGTLHNPASTASMNINPLPKPFVAPAHPQSHHLHTLPPREKTTRTLILDHTAWRHGRTRFAQGRCELKMKVRFKSEEQTVDASGIGSSGAEKRGGFYIGSGPRQRHVTDFGDPPEAELASSEDEGDYDSETKEGDSEGTWGLAYGAHIAQPGRAGESQVKTDRMDVDTENGSSVGYGSDAEGNITLASSLAARATGIEKVLHAMLAQPPSSPPRSPSPPAYGLRIGHPNGQQSAPPPSVQQMAPAPVADLARVLPNGLRLRLALLTLVNDLFERQPPPSQDESFSPIESSPGKSIITPSNVSSPELLSALPPPSISPKNALPSGLATFAQISGQMFYEDTTLPSFHTLTMPSSSGGPGPASATLSATSGTSPGLSATTSSNASWTTLSGGQTPADDGQPTPHVRRQPPPIFAWSRSSGGPTPSTSSGPLPLAHDKDYDRCAANPSSPQQMFPPRLQVSSNARPLPSSWVGSPPKHMPDKSSSSAIPGLVKRARGRSRDLYLAGCYTAPSPASSFRSNVPTYTYGTGVAPVLPSGYPLKKLKTLCPRHLREKCRICVAGRIKRGAPSTRIGAGLLRRQGCLLASNGKDSKKHTGSVLADLIPRFLRLSALVAMELGREARGEEPEAIEGQDDKKVDLVAPAPLPIVSSTKTAAHSLPTRAWFALLCGLLTRAVLEGYVARGWKGPEYAEVLMGVGLGIKGVGTRGKRAASIEDVQDVSTEEEDTDEFEPDEMPRLVDACKVLFNGLVQDVSAPEAKEKATREAEAEYVTEMEERMSEFLTIPHATPDLATHLTQLSEKYPAEPVERAALYFCEAVAKWRGKPELEMYKKTPGLATKGTSSTPAPLPINSLLASAPTTPTPQRRPPIDKYFREPPLPLSGSSASSLSSPTISRNRPGAGTGAVAAGGGDAQPPLQPQRTLKRRREEDGGDDAPGGEEERQQQPKREKVEGAMEIDLGKVTGDVHVEEAVQEDAEWVGPYGV